MIFEDETTRLDTFIDECMRADSISRLYQEKRKVHFSLYCTTSSKIADMRFVWF